MNSTIADQKIARRRPPRLRPTGKKPGIADLGRGLFGRGSGPGPSSFPRTDFLFLEGAAGTRKLRPGPAVPREKQGIGPRIGHGRKLKVSSILLRIAGAVSRLRLPGPRSSGRRNLPVHAIKWAGLASAAFALAITAFALVRGPAFPQPEIGLLLSESSAQDLLLAYVSPELAGDSADPGDGVSTPPPPLATLEVRTYTVRSGDTIPVVAKRFGISSDTLISMNGITSARAFKVGIELRVPNMEGLVHKVGAGESIGSIAKRYRTDMTRIVDANDLVSSVVRPGQTIFIPGAHLSESELRKVFGERVAWPIRGPLSSYFGYRPDPFTGVRSFHGGIDIVAAPGSPVKAAMDGRVADVGYNPNFGNYVILSHADGLQTLYGHLTSYSVKEGMSVAQGSVIGLVGSTGYSTGPHLHFGLFHGGAAVNPLKYLK